MKKILHIKPNKSLSNLQILFFLIITGFLITFIGARFLLVGAWPIIIFGMVEFLILVTCTFYFLKKVKKTEKISFDNQTMYLDNLDGKKLIEKNSYNLNWSQINNEKSSLSITYSGKKKLFAKFLSENKRLKLKKIIERYRSYAN